MDELPTINIAKVTTLYQYVVKKHCVNKPFQNRCNYSKYPMLYYP